MATIKEILKTSADMWRRLFNGTVVAYSHCFYRAALLTILGCAFMYPPYAVFIVFALVSAYEMLWLDCIRKTGLRFIAWFVSLLGIVLGYFAVWLIANYGVTFHAV